MSETRRQQATASSSMLAIDLTSRPTFRMYPLGLVDNLGELRWLQNKRSIFPSMCITLDIPHPLQVGCCVAANGNGMLRPLAAVVSSSGVPSPTSIAGHCPWQGANVIHHDHVLGPVPS